jgi:hypothetical protein
MESVDVSSSKIHFLSQTVIKLFFASPSSKVERPLALMSKVHPPLNEQSRSVEDPVISRGLVSLRSWAVVIYRAA